MKLYQLSQFFPLHYNWHAFLQRLRGAGYESALIARLIVSSLLYAPEAITDRQLIGVT